jgi:hypothetical protein
VSKNGKSDVQYFRQFEKNNQMKKTPYILLACVALFCSCENETNNVTEEGMPVALNIEDISVQTSTTRSATTLTTSGDAIGLFLSAGTAYSALDNVKYTYTTAWAATSTSIYLTKSNASLCAYYPYVDGATVTRSLAPTTYSAASDLCYKNGLSASSTANSLSLEMGHAYSQLTLNISKGTYTGTGLISSITFANVGLITSSTLDISSGSYTTVTTGGLYTDASPAVSDLSTAATKQYLMVPCTLSGSTTLVLNVDGSNRVGSISNANLAALVAGSNHAVNILLTATSFVVSSVSTTDWVTGSSYSMLPIETANCYMVTPSNAIIIPVNIKGNGDDVAGTGLSTTHTAASVGVLWQTSAGLVTVSGFSSSAQTVTVTAGTASGNAVIAAYDTDGTTILWSWHIWVTSYNPNTSSNGTTYSYTNTSGISNVFMDRNLGATSVAAADVNTLGLLYQWGRKDPFVNASTYNGTTDLSVIGTAITITSGPTTLANSITTPTTLYYNTLYPYDWNSSSNTNLWSGASYGATKTIFDPCPSGWRVPSFYKTSTRTSPWIGLETYKGSTYWDTNGFQWTASPPSVGFWPAAGYRFPTTGKLSAVGSGSSGFYWSASPNGNYRNMLGFSSGNITPSDNGYRGSGYSVRCVQEW